MNDKVTSSRKASVAKGKVLIENRKTRVTKWSFQKKGDNTGWHRHEFDYLIVPLFSGGLEIFDGEKVSAVLLETGKPYFREKGVEHDVINANEFACDFIEIEFLT